MFDFLLSPIKAIYNLDTYIKAKKQSFGKSFLFFIYLIVITSILFLTGMLLKVPSVDPLLRELTTEIAQVIPNIEIRNGVINANNNEYFEIQNDESFPKIVFETNRTEPVYPTQMVQNNTAVLVTDKTIYIASNGQFQTYHLDKNINMDINEQYIMDNQESIIKDIKKILFLVLTVSMPVIVTILALILLVLAICAAAITEISVKADVSLKNILSMCLYMLAPALFFILLVILLPFNIPLVWLICFVIFMIYSRLVLVKIKTSEIAADYDKGEENKA